jgi:hypothetical protein
LWNQLLLEINAELETKIMILGIQCLQQLQPASFSMKIFEQNASSGSTASVDGPEKLVHFAACRQPFCWKTSTAQELFCP